jgi:4-hydroxy-tetrahydrodipicolinate synthase
MRGVHSILPTPFLPSGVVDHDSLARVIELYIDAGVDGLTALGVTSEVAQLNGRERDEILDTVFSTVSGRLPVMVGTTAAATRSCIELSQAAEAAGASSVMVSPPRLPKLDSDLVLRHFRELADAVDLQIVIQDYPPISGFTMEPGLLVRLAESVPQARTVKLEDPPTALKTAQILDAGADCEIHVLGGLGGAFLLEELLSGAAGALTGFCYPEILVAVVRLFDDGDIDAAADLFYRWTPLLRYEFQPVIGSAIRKEMLRRRGVFGHNIVRPPGWSLDAHTRRTLDQLLDWVGENLDLTTIPASA